MIPLYAVFGALIICGGYILATFKKPTALDKPFKLAVIIAAGIALGMLICSLGGSAKTDAEYEQLILYKPIVEACDDEAIRFDYHERVREWNENYAEWLKNEGSLWFDWCHSDNLYSDGVDFINFNLRRG